jgi:U3 small nucleolar RNA-associated protein 6
MSNVDGLYATDEIEAGTVIFTEETMPDGSLGRSSEPNCDRLELEDGQLAIVSSRDIAAGEFFCIAETDEESDSSEVDEEASDM